MSLVDSVLARFHTYFDLRRPEVTIDLLRFITEQGPAYRPRFWNARQATSDCDLPFTPSDLGSLTADLADPEAVSVDLYQEPAGPYQLSVYWGSQHHGNQSPGRGQVLLSLPYEQFSGSSAFDRVGQWVAVLTRIYSQTGAYYGFSHESCDYHALTSIITPTRSRPRTQAEAAGLFWANFLGPQLVQAIGMARLQSVDCWRKESLADGGMLLIFSPNPLDFETSRGQRARLYEEWGLERLTMPQLRARPLPLSAPRVSEPLVDSVEQCREYANLCVRLAQQIDQTQLDFSPASLRRLDDIIRNGWQVGQTPDEVIVVMGCYVGETVIRQLGGEWTWQDPGVGMILPHVLRGREHLNVIGKVKKRFEFGDADSIAAFFEMAASKRD